VDSNLYLIYGSSAIKSYKTIPGYPLIKIDTDKITQNARKIIRMCSKHSIEAYPVLKAACGFAPPVDAALKACPEGVFDSSITDLAAAGGAGNTKIRRGLLRLFSKNELACNREYLDALDYFFVSDMYHLKALGELKPGAAVILAVDSGDLREGIPLGELDGFIAAALKVKTVRIFGAATNHACFSGIVPTAPIIDKFVEKIEEAERKFGFEFQMVSGGNSSLIGLIEENAANERINNIRVGEALFLGTDVLTRKPIKWLKQDTFRVEAEVIECREKDSILDGVRTQNAFNEVIDFDKRNIKPGAKTLRAIVALGKKHFYVNGIRPMEKGVFVVGASSDYLIADVTRCGRRVKCGDTLEFSLDYAALMSAMRAAGRYMSYSIVNS